MITVAASVTIRQLKTATADAMSERWLGITRPACGGVTTAILPMGRVGRGEIPGVLEPTDDYLESLAIVIRGKLPI